MRVSEVNHYGAAERPRPPSSRCFKAGQVLLPAEIGTISSIEVQARRNPSAAR